MIAFKGGSAVCTASPGITTGARAIRGRGSRPPRTQCSRSRMALRSVSTRSMCGAVRKPQTTFANSTIRSVLFAWKSSASATGTRRPIFARTLSSRYSSPLPIPSTTIAPCKYSHTPSSPSAGSASTMPCASFRKSSLATGPPGSACAYSVGTIWAPASSSMSPILTFSSMSRPYARSKSASHVLTGESVLLSH
ncbi:MAG: hypothetical protein BWY81_01207 [Firmicutes bacterium ADurb.Bin467]|nr:MAG: hypothetical protein BWY81_01207 [Firmicutes bacterium ADurb.Bin467]